MAKLKTRPFKGVSKTSETFEYLAEVSVDSGGIFSVTLDDALEQAAVSLLKQDKWHRAQLLIDRPRKNLRVSGPVLDDVERFINSAITEFLHCEEKRELVILYGASSTVSYSKNEAGEIGSNGYVVANGRHHGSLHATSLAPFYSVGFAAVVREKRTFIRSASTKVSYHKPDRPNVFTPENYIDKLNSFIGLKLDESRLQEMPYTEEAAKFFHDTMLAICVLADRIESFFGDKERLMLAIDKQTPLLGLAPSTNEQ